VCDVEAGRCAAGPGSPLQGASVPWVAKVPAQKVKGASAAGRPWTAVTAAKGGRDAEAVADA